MNNNIVSTPILINKYSTFYSNNNYKKDKENNIKFPNTNSNTELINKKSSNFLIKSFDDILLTKESKELKEFQSEKKPKKDFTITSILFNKNNNKTADFECKIFL